MSNFHGILLLTKPKIKQVSPFSVMIKWKSNILLLVIPILVRQRVCWHKFMKASDRESEESVFVSDAGKFQPQQ